MKRLSMVLVLALTALAMGGCRFAVVESDTVKIGWAPAALAESGVLGLESRDAEGETRVRQLQKRLAELAYLDEAADGIFGKNTQTALMAFQRASGLPETGVLDEETAAALYPPSDGSPTPTPAPTPQAPGAEGSAVEAIQRSLLAYGFSTQEVSGKYDEETREAVAAFQEYAIEYYGTEFDDPLPVSELLPEPMLLEEGETLPERPAEETSIPAMAAPTPEPTLRPEREVDGLVSQNLYDYITSGRFPVFREPLQRGDAGSDVARLQRRLSALGYFYDKVDGSFGRLTVESLKAFQADNALQRTGIADAETQRRLYSEAIQAIAPAERPYYIKVSLEDQRVYVYRWHDGGYNLLIKNMICSTGMAGHATPKGVFTSAGHSGGRWHYFEDYQCWAQYAFNIHGNILFHSVLFSRNSESSLRRGSVSMLGRRASHGCVRLKVEDAKWIYMNCGKGQVVEIY